MNQLKIVSLFLFLIIIVSVPTAAASLPTPQGQAARYLLSHYNAKLGLLYESEDAGQQWFSASIGHANTYWVYSDNTFASLALAPFNPAVANRLEATVQAYDLPAGNYAPLLGIPVSYFNTTQMIIIRNGTSYVIISNTPTSQPMVINLTYADIAVYHALNLYEQGKAATAQKVLTYVFHMWNGTCIVDAATLAQPTRANQEWTNAGYCANYKIALILYAAQVLGLRAPNGMQQYLWSQQLANGGIASLSQAGRPLGSANTETTSLALLSFNQQLIAEIQAEAYK